MKPDCKLDFCDRRAQSRDGLCRAHADQQRQGIQLRPIHPWRRWTGCSFPGCDRPHKTRGLCVAHVRQQERGRELTPIGASRAKPAAKATKLAVKPAKKAKRQPSAKRPPSVLPDGWDRTTAPREPRRAVDKTFYGVPVVPPMHPATLAAALVGLRDLGADDLAEVLGVSPDQIRAEADRWLMWEGVE